MFIVDPGRSALGDVEFGVDLIQERWVSSFRNPLKHSLELGLQGAFEPALTDRGWVSWTNEKASKLFLKKCMN